MAHRQQALIDKLNGEGAEEQDHSLQRQARDRALGKAVPKTMTPWEWEQYYEQHGVPDTHRRAGAAKNTGTSSSPWWKRWLGARD